MVTYYYAHIKYCFGLQEKIKKEKKKSLSDYKPLEIKARQALFSVNLKNKLRGGDQMFGLGKKCPAILFTHEYSNRNWKIKMCKWHKRLQKNSGNSQLYKTVGLRITELACLMV